MNLRVFYKLNKAKLFFLDLLFERLSDFFYSPNSIKGIFWLDSDLRDFFNSKIYLEKVVETRLISNIAEYHGKSINEV